MIRLIPLALASIAVSCNQPKPRASVDCSALEARVADLELELKIRDLVDARVAALEGRIAKDAANQWSHEFDIDFLEEYEPRMIMRNGLTSDRDSPALEIVCQDGKFDILLFLGTGQVLPIGEYVILLKYRKSTGPNEMIALTDTVAVKKIKPNERFMLPNRAMDALLAHETLEVVVLTMDDAPPKFQGTFHLTGLAKRLATRGPLQDNDNICGI